jgi:alkanesulfonate monooxygenase SsuD/methylene tetrahydromethanopterin reductase-like flavin-dependent oxidoreductase (luciferase family)
MLATAIAVRTSRLRVGIGVLVHPLGHPIRMAEEVATLDNICEGGLDLCGALCGSTPGGPAAARKEAVSLASPVDTPKYGWKAIPVGA